MIDALLRAQIHFGCTTFTCTETKGLVKLFDHDGHMVAMVWLHKEGCWEKY